MDHTNQTPLQAALGQGGGFGFGGRAGVVREDTARVIAELTGVSLRDARAQAATSGRARASGNRPAGAARRPRAGPRSRQLIS
jgi:hypothetical protein